jgi:preprotein translocase subunit SecG
MDAVTIIVAIVFFFIVLAVSGLVADSEDAYRAGVRKGPNHP